MLGTCLHNDKKGGVTYNSHPRVQSLERKADINQIAVPGKVTLQRQLVPRMEIG